MMKNTIILDRRYNHKKIGSNSRAKYAFDGREVIFFYKDNKVYKRSATYGDCFEIIYNWGGINVTQIKLPKDDAQLLLWILGFKKDTRVLQNNGTVYEKIRNKRRKELMSMYDSDYYEEVYVSESYILTYADSEKSSSKLRVVGWVDNDISKDQIIEILNRFPGIEKFDRNLITGILKIRFGFDYDDIEQLKNLRF